MLMFDCNPPGSRPAVWAGFCQCEASNSRHPQHPDHQPLRGARQMGAQEGLGKGVQQGIVKIGQNADHRRRASTTSSQGHTDGLYPRVKDCTWRVSASCRPAYVDLSTRASATSSTVGPFFRSSIRTPLPLGPITMLARLDCASTLTLTLPSGRPLSWPVSFSLLAIAVCSGQGLTAKAPTRTTGPGSH